MTMFPGPGATIYRNEAGEPLGWDYPSSDETAGCDPYDDDGYGGSQSAADAAAEDAYEAGVTDAEEGNDRNEAYGADNTNRGNTAAGWLQDSYNDGYDDASANIRAELAAEVGDEQVPATVCGECDVDGGHSRACPLYVNDESEGVE